MSALTLLSERLQERLGVDSSYLASDIPNGVSRCVKRLLRDYHFPKSVRTEIWKNVSPGQQVYTLPADFKKDLMVTFQDTSDVVPVYTNPLKKREGFTLANQDQVPRYYWLQGNDLWTDIAIPSGTTKTHLIAAYESNDVGYNLEWMVQDMEDVLFSFTMFRLSSEFGKPELAQVYVALWTEDQRSLAIYLNELEFGNMEMMMRASTPGHSPRYPVL